VARLERANPSPKPAAGKTSTSGGAALFDMRSKVPAAPATPPPAKILMAPAETFTAAIAVETTKLPEAGPTA
jgi:hypothetical protein